VLRKGLLIAVLIGVILTDYKTRKEKIKSLFKVSQKEKTAFKKVVSIARKIKTNLDKPQPKSRRKGRSLRSNEWREEYGWLDTPKHYRKRSKPQQHNDDRYKALINNEANRYKALTG